MPKTEGRAVLVALLAASGCIGADDAALTVNEGPDTAVQGAALVDADLVPIAPQGDPRGPANFGWSVATDGARVVVGANRVGDTVGSEGAAYVFERGPGGQLLQVARLRAAEAPQAANFGQAVAIADDYAVVGAPYLDRNGLANPGASYVFRRASDGSWAQTQRLVGLTTPNAYFGGAVATSGTRLYVGEWGTNRVYAYDRDGTGTYVLRSTLSAPDSVTGDRFGAALAAQGSVVLVGAPYAGARAGAVYTFANDGSGTPVLGNRVNGGAADQFLGRALALAAEGGAVGAQGFARTLSVNGGLGSLGQLLAPPGVGSDFGIAVARAGTRILVGSYLSDDAPLKDNGAVYAFTQGPSGFALAERLTSPTRASTDYLGFSVAMAGGLAVVGAYGDDELASNGGLAYVAALEPAQSCPPGSRCAPARALESCGTWRLDGAQTLDPEGDRIATAALKLPSPRALILPASIKLTTPPAGTAAYLYFHDDDRMVDVRCRYQPGGADPSQWPLTGCRAPRRGALPISGGHTLRASEVRFRIGGGDHLEGGASVAGTAQLRETRSCNDVALTDCASLTASAQRYADDVERVVSLGRSSPLSVPVPPSVAVTSSGGARSGQRAELGFFVGATRHTVCTYQASTEGATSLAFGGCVPSAGVGTQLSATRVALSLGPVGRRVTPLAASVDLAPQSPVCASGDADGDGVPTLSELAASRAIGVADVDHDGLANWEDSDADGDGTPDGNEAGDTNANLVNDYVDLPCEPATYYADADGDGFGNPNLSVFACPPPAGYVDNAADCNDAADAVSPADAEVCGDEIDNDCDLVVDEECTPPACVAAPEQGEGTILSSLQAGHGFTANAGGGSLHNLNDLVDYAIGTQSAWIDTNGFGAAKTLKRSALGTFDFTNKMPRIWVKLDNLLNASSLQLYLGNNNLASHYKFAFESTQGQQWTTEGDWVGFSMSWSTKHTSIVGTPNRAAITDVQLRAIDKNTGNSLRLHANQFSMVDEPVVDYPNGVLSVTFDDGYASQYSLAKPILDAYGFPATDYVIMDKVDTAGYQTVANLLDLQNNAGWEIAYHAFDSDVHTAGFPATPQLDLEQDIDLARQWLFDNGLTDHCNCAYPHGAFTGATDVLGVVGSKLATCRTIHQKHREAYPPSDAYKLRVLLVSKPTTVASVTAALDQAKANREWIILVFHNLTDTPVDNIDYDPDDFDTIMAHASSIGLPAKTVADVLW